LGSGDKSIQETLEKAVKKNPKQLGLRMDFDEPLAHHIMAGADMFLIPSRYEPCGLTQMYALKYGTIPIVRNTGGLKDAITAFNPKTGKGNGFKFTDYKPKAFLTSIRDAISQYHKAENWKKLRVSAMKEDFSWDQSAKRYLKLYRTTLKVK
jgi:starch synthase